MTISRYNALAVVFCVVLLITVADPAIAADYTPVYDRIDIGDLEGARLELQDILADSYLDTEALLLQALVEPKGDLSLELLQKCLLLCEDEECGDVPARLAEAYYVVGRYEDVVELYKSFRKDVVYERASLNLYWFAGMSYLALNEYSDAEKVFKEIRKKYSDSNLGAWGNLGLASAKFAREKHSDARSILQNLGRRQTCASIRDALSA